VAASIGTLALDRQIRALNAVIHVFGHSHIDFDEMVEGVRYIQHALDYPLEEGWSKDPIKQIWESTAQTECGRRRKEI
jgi:hypothetical protein